MTTLYNLHTDGDQYRVTKFVDGNPEGSYLVSHTECQCPAGHRSSCRHRQMLPLMLSHNLLNTPWFWDFDRQRATDFNGQDMPTINPFAPLHAGEPFIDIKGPPMNQFIVVENDERAEGISPALPSKPASWRRI